MALSGFGASCGDRSGGVASVSLVRVAEIVAVDTSGGSVADVVLADGCSFADYAFAEGSAALSETASREAGATLVRHELSFALTAADSRAAAVATELERASHEGGLVALVTTVSGEKLLVGWSPKFGAGQPLRLLSAGIGTGVRKADAPLCRIVLHSLDDAYSQPVIG